MHAIRLPHHVESPQDFQGEELDVERRGAEDGFIHDFGYGPDQHFMVPFEDFFVYLVLVGPRFDQSVLRYFDFELVRCHQVRIDELKYTSDFSLPLCVVAQGNGQDTPFEEGRDLLHNKLGQEGGTRRRVVWLLKRRSRTGVGFRRNSLIRADWLVPIWSIGKLRLFL